MKNVVRVTSLNNNGGVQELLNKAAVIIFIYTLHVLVWVGTPLKVESFVRRDCPTEKL